MSKHFTSKVRTIINNTPKLPRTAKVTVVHQRKNGTDYATDHLKLTPQQYAYILELLNDRIKEVKDQPGTHFRETLVLEREFAIDLLCTLDI